MKLTDIFWPFRSDMDYIERELDRAIDTKEPVLQKTSSHLLKAGGKRIRPVFVLLGGKFGNYDIERLKHVAVSLELIHMASLVHDDVIDDAELRRGKMTVKSKWDNRIAMYTGDYIFARALMIATELSNPQIHKILSRAIVDLCTGEIEQIRDLHNWNQSLRNYLRRIKRKTALLIAISCQLGALAADATPDVVHRLYVYGYNVGMAFQITDDILDFIGDEKKLGKPAGSDLRQGNITLPALYMYHVSPDARCFRELVKENRVDEMIRVIRESEGIQVARRLAERYLTRAAQALTPLPDNKSKDALLKIARFIGERQF
ncbi:MULTISPECIES: heptaprenyl diphosphate synthase component II [Aneurinibacillus]|uniref:Heptaprenyl diphosphate synthase component 2 n=1 Tax=Aneurinibacillus thermoaerophilus TaxID=143495 RepID=A0A1G8BR02_ANETH|nr:MULTISPECIES: heptaprenyl diphosphate synthase component II [Aneurinibacillus]AMA73574.1 heptaprenyl diphosphate synthase [Aneurinibacillus sp. XH2]MED0674965.1 heptaprenyl diphosphate synthase component II [Aneurinibacillus thermoaerophilus]MED0737368.1 heptaprenyl diphosphate synthase component II [Aneurinibacillus thermoaerophilus]MED0756217.1 heptaprenyl diphosphate synthase component II [Aneurinibacillus thermoaerophilus]MED0760348.1 heptaprenyl diphosphate synthase component II [Aneur